MAVIAIAAAVNMGRILACCGDTIVTGAARTNNLVVVNGYHRCKDVTAVTVLANVCRLYVCWILAGGICAVMAADTITDDIRMVEICGQPGNRAVAIVTGVATGNMRGVFAGGICAVVAGTATSQDLGVIHGYCRHKHIRAVAVFANIGRLHVRRASADGVRTVMA